MFDIDPRPYSHHVVSPYDSSSLDDLQLQGSQTDDPILEANDPLDIDGIDDGMTIFPLYCTPLQAAD
jgi:hypothetical protein